MPNLWQPISTIPAAGKFLIEKRSPPNWASWVNTLVLHDDDPPDQRETRLHYAVAWMDYPPVSGFAGDEDG